MDEEQINFEWSLTPHNASSESKTGITFKGKDTEYIHAHAKLAEMFTTKGESFLINGIEIRISDVPKNKPLIIEVKPKNGLSGRSNLKIYSINKRGGATIHITKVSGGNLLHSKILAFDVIKYLLDNLISGNITDDDMVGFKKINLSKDDNKCTICDKKFSNQQGLKVHKTKVHAEEKSFNCDDCESSCKTKSELEKHTNEIHVMVSSPESKKLKIGDSNDAGLIKEKDYIEKDEAMDIDFKEDDTEILSKRRDEKILEKQKSEEEKEVILKGISRKRQIVTEEEEKKRKRQMSVEKKKRKKKARREKKKEDEGKENIEITEKSKLVQINVKYANIFKEEGLDIEDFVIYKVKGDGACGATCTAVHCHRDEKLGIYVRRNTNEYIAQFWPFFKDHISFPHTQLVGCETVTFENESEYLTFLKKNAKSGLLWMDHGDMQAVANMYQIQIHILTTNIVNLEETNARWTHIQPDHRLKSFSKVPIGLPDMFLLHVDDQHFDLLIHKNSTLAQEGSIESQNDPKKVVTEEVIDSEKEDIEEDVISPGYMGWQIGEEEKDFNNLRYKALQDAYKHLEKEYKALDDEYKELKKKYDEENDWKSVKQMTKEMKGLKEEYKELIEVLKKETHEKTKAEIEVQTLKDIFHAEKELKNDEPEQMEIDEAMGEWIQQQKRKSLKIPKAKIMSYKCEKCENTFRKHEELSNHIQEHVENMQEKKGKEKHVESHTKAEVHKCKKCNQSYDNEKGLSVHLQTHTSSGFNCTNCNETFELKERLEQHRLQHSKTSEVIDSNGESEVKCGKCEKVYGNMSKLRRHDWRSHREVECNICEMKIRNRSEISVHRRKEHQMYKIAKCRYFPNCIDADECFFQHDGESHNKSKVDDMKKLTFCPEGENCRNQSCEYNEEKHKELKHILCRFQSKCNRPECAFKHIVDRAAFLEVCRQSYKTK